MELEQRIEELEREVKTLKEEIQKTLVEIEKNLPSKVNTPQRWEKRAWLLALLNIILAIVLFTNIYLYLPGSQLPFALAPALETWLRAGWVALAFIWLLLQMYPLVLLLEQDDPTWQRMTWRNAITFMRARPVWLLFITVIVLGVAVLNTVMPAAWLFVALVLLIGVGVWIVLAIVELLRRRVRA